jgi:hypothetical protein
MSYLPFWLSGLLLASVPILHWVVLRRALAVSGRYTVLIDRARFGAPGEPTTDLSEAELIAALRSATADAFGEAALEAPPEPLSTGARSAPRVRVPSSSTVHVLFFVGLLLGGTLSFALGPGVSPSFELHGALFSHYFGSSPLAAAGVLVGGGMLVGAGTRMAGGCTSGHGLCGVSQLQPGSLVATGSFFITGVITSFLLRALS